jgi:hypothetical protein
LQCHEKNNRYCFGLGHFHRRSISWRTSHRFRAQRGHLRRKSIERLADGKTLLMDVDLGSEHERKNWDGPQPAIYAFDLAIEKTKRLTDKNDFVWDPYWLTDDEFLCVIQKARENESSVYRMLVSGKNAKLLAKHARTPSASAP